MRKDRDGVEIVFFQEVMRPEPQGERKGVECVPQRLQNRGGKIFSASLLYVTEKSIGGVVEHIGSVQKTLPVGQARVKLLPVA